MASTPDSSCDWLFVYGLLKRGQPAAPLLCQGHRWGRGCLSGFALHDPGTYPMAVPAVGSIHGEWWLVPQALLQALDAYEDVPDEYRRQAVTAPAGGRGWIYVGAPGRAAGSPRIALADWGTQPLFSYGTNLLPERLFSRCPGWDREGWVAELPGWRWALCKRRLTRPASAAAGLIPDPSASCWGVVSHLSPCDLARLDDVEGVRLGHYRRAVVSVRHGTDQLLPVFTYLPLPHRLVHGLPVADDYAAAVVAGARQMSLPSPWTAWLVDQCQSLSGRCRAPAGGHRDRGRPARSNGRRSRS
ncbi:MAG: gamma-glutamylcyclotransferase [Aphanocapsa feldmannii 288cV]|nr:MAG: gamma-glutamylcyclotransferase [Aphanocapsa feldmannii 288cV]